MITSLALTGKPISSGKVGVGLLQEAKKDTHGEGGELIKLFLPHYLSHAMFVDVNQKW